MKRILFVCLVFLFMMAHAADFRKMSPLVRQAAVEEMRSKEMRSREQVSRSERVGAKPLITAFVRIVGSRSDSLLQHYRSRPLARKGDITIASIPLESLSPLSEHPAVRRIEAGRRASLCLDTTARAINALPAYIASPTHQAYTGRDVVVGLMDVGFDLTHPNFYDPLTNTTRIGALWDQLSKDTVGSMLPVGRSIEGYEAVRAYGHSTDGRTLRHGTHTLGIAAGNGYDTPYRGVAFESDICLVSNAISSDIEYIDSADLYKYTTAVDALGFKYLFDYADARRMPCVASFSEGYPPYADSEDSLYSAFIDSIVGPGHILVAAAGNENRERTYAMKPAGTETAGAFIRSYHENALYRVKADNRLKIHLYAYQGEQGIPTDTLTFTSADNRLDSLVSETFFFPKDTCTILVTRYTSAFDGDTVYALYLSATSTLNALPQMALVLEGTDSRAEIFGSSSAALTSRTTDPRWNAAETGHDIFAPACFPSVICVGSTSHRLSVVNHQGEAQNYLAGPVSGVISPFSSTGPAFNGLMKPDVVAPGSNVVSSDSEFYYTQDSTYSRHEIITYSEFEGKQYPWCFNSGTSMSAPAVAGVIALWLQAKPDLTPQEVMSIIASTARRPDASAPYPNNTYGYGEIDCYRGLLNILGLSGIGDISSSQPLRLRITPDQGRLHLFISEPSAHPLHIRIYSLSGTLLLEHSVERQVSETVISLPRAYRGVCLVQATSEEKSLTGSLLVRL